MNGQSNGSYRKKTNFRTVFLTCLVTLLSVVLISGCSGGPRADAGEDSRNVQKLTIAFTNDIQGHALETKPRWLDRDDPRMAGGIARLGRFLKQERSRASKQDRAFLYIDAGDWFTGAPESDLLEGKPVIRGLNEVGLNYTTIGNHEFDYGQETLFKRLDQLNATTVISNLKYEKDGELVQFPGTKPWVIEKQNGLRIGIFGLTYDDSRDIIFKKYIEGVHFQDEVKSARRAVKELQKRNPDIIVGITHITSDRDRKLARKVDGIDFLFGAHDHTRIEEPEIVNGTRIMQAGSDMTAVGRMDVTVDTETSEIQEASGELVNLIEGKFEPLPHIEKMYDKMLSDILKRLKQPVGKTTAAIPHDPTTTSPLGNLITNNFRRRSDADIAFQNAFGIRSDLPEGVVTLRDTFQVHPFGNFLVTMDLTGKQIREVLEKNMEEADIRMQMSGMTVKVNPEAPKGKRVKQVLVDGQELVDDQTYRVAVSNFIAQGGDAYTTFKEGTNRKSFPDKTLQKLLEQYIHNNSPVEPPIETRYEEVKTPASQSK